MLNRSLDLQDVEQNLKESIKSVEKDMERVTQKMENVATDESNLDTQIEKRREDMERARKRLEALKSVRSASTSPPIHPSDPTVSLLQSCIHGRVRKTGTRTILCL